MATDKIYNVVATVVMVLSCLPLVFYPAILMAGVMGLAAPPNKVMSATLFVSKAFLWLSLLYPVWWAISAAVYAFKSAVVGSTMAAGYLLLCLALFAAWYWGAAR